MSTMNEGPSEGSEISLSEAVGEGPAAILQIASHLAQYAVGFDDKLTPEAEIHLALRSPEGRHEMLEKIIREVCPDAADERLWLSWLEGGESPFQPRELKSPVVGKEKPNAALSRTTDRVADREKKVAKASERVAAAERELADAKRELIAVRNYESAIVHYYVARHLIDIIKPVFAMGPAWTIMRSLSGHLPEEVGLKAVDGLVGEDKEMALAGLRSDRQVDSAQMLKTLDYLSGISEFEEALRAAVFKVVKDFGAKADSLVKDGRRPRSKEAMETKIHPKAQGEAEEILEGLKKAS